MNETEDSVWEKINSYQMSPDDIVKAVESCCRKSGVKELYLFGSFAAGNPTPTSDIDFVVKGCPDIDELQDLVDEIPTLRTIDLFDYDHIRNENLLKDIRDYAKKIY